MDGASITAYFSTIEAWYAELKVMGPPLGYYPEPTKSIIMVSAESEVAAKEFFGPRGFKVSTGGHYLGSYLGESDGARSFVREKI